jgi:hypothetical protein
MGAFAMSLSLSRRLPGGHSHTASIAALEYEIAHERASALGRLGRALEAALAALSDHDDRSGERDAARARLVQDASDALWYFMVQREACGLRDPRPVLRDYGVPAEVYARMGAFGRR